MNHMPGTHIPPPGLGAVRPMGISEDGSHSTAFPRSSSPFPLTPFRSLSLTSTKTLCAAIIRQSDICLWRTDKQPYIHTCRLPQISARQDRCTFPRHTVCDARAVSERRRAPSPTKRLYKQENVLPAATCSLTLEIIARLTCQVCISHNATALPATGPCCYIEDI